jgi:hypothetical protein
MPAPPTLVVLVRPHHVQPAWAHLYRAVQKAASNRVRLLPSVPATCRTSCTLVCDDAVLVDNLS